MKFLLKLRQVQNHKTIRKLLKFAFANYFITLFGLIILFVGVVIVIKILFSTPTYVYAKVKVGQGYWWANTSQPAIWLVNSVKKGDTQYDLVGKPVVEVIHKTVYPGFNGFDIYLTVLMRVNQNKKRKIFTFNRSSLSVGSPVELQFPNADITGTVIELSKKPSPPKYIDKILYLVNQGGYSKDFPYRYDTIQVGDKYFDGEEYVFEILEKKLEKNIWTIANNLNAQVYEREVNTTQNIVVKAKVKVEKKGNGLYYGESYKLITNGGIPFSTPNVFLDGFVVRKIE